MAVVKTDDVVLSARGFYGLPLLRQLGLMVGLAASVALGVAVVLWSQTPDYRMLYSNLSAQDSASIVESLQKAGIPYSLGDGSGTVMVPEKSVHEARLKLAGEGLPRGAGAGFDLLDKQKGFGVSQFMENARYQRALEGELAMTIASVHAVRAARVHLAIPKQTAFARNQKRPTASVMVDLFPGRSLNEAQAAAISHMVAASIPNLDVDQVTIVDQQGRLLTANEGDGEMRLSGTQFEYRKRLEEYYIRRIEDILTPIVGAGAVKAQVNADIDFTVTEQTQETFAPDQRAVRSEQLVEENVSGGRLPFGIPGSLSNQPPAEAAGAGETAAASGSSSRRNVRNYEIDKTISHSRMSGGTVRRLSAAVVVDHRTSVNEEGAAVRTSLGEDEIERITQLVREAVGFDAERGDSVNVVNAAFTQAPEAEPMEEPSALAAIDIRGLLKQGLAVLVVLLLIFGVLRPVLRELASKGRMPAPAPALPQGALADDQLTLGGGRQAALPKGQNFETNLEAARSLAAQDPKRVAQVVRNWVTAE
jgi:flagellar M-ring protein FliF